MCIAFVILALEDNLTGFALVQLSDTDFTALAAGYLVLGFLDLGLDGVAPPSLSAVLARLQAAKLAPVNVFWL
jgi:hypothetical protein